MVRVAFQGERGSYSEEAVVRFFGEAELMPCLVLSDVFKAVSTGQAAFGVVPVENSQAGSINESYDLLLNYPLNIYGEVFVRVSHCLLALPGEKIGSIKTIYSHPQAIAQSEDFLRRLNVEIVPTYDTAGSAKMIREKQLKGAAAIASRNAARIYGLEILAEHIETNPNNYTRFVVISEERAKRAEKNKTSIVFAVRNVPGALYSVLGAFANRSINLTKLESRPRRDRPWEYIFYVDFEGHREDEVWRDALNEVREKVTFIKILGSYPQAEA
ncbi:MAG: prephenate dehydratase [Dehalococcoidia bacterium]|nr:prephenate dehydratase [Dehalococcoidia bacterium]